jgi:FHS family L-fucose permease-like MFS transporter
MSRIKQYIPEEYIYIPLYRTQVANIPAQNITISERTAGVKSNYAPALVFMGVLYLMIGVITCLNDTLVPFFKDGFTLNYAQSSLVQFYFFLTYGIMSVPAARLVDRIGYKHGMMTGFVVAAFGAILFYPAAMYQQYFLFLGALFVIAIGIVLLQVAVNPYVTALGPAKTASSRLTLVQGLGSVGTTVAPVFGAYFILSELKNKEVSPYVLVYPYLGIALVLFLIAFLVWRLNLPQVKAGPYTLSSSDPGRPLLSFPNLKFGIWGIFCYVGAEVAIGTFLTNYVAEVLVIPVHDANTYVTFYWGSMLGGRLLGAAILKSVRPPLVLSVCGGLAVFLILFSINTGGLTAVWSMIAVGLCNSVMFAIIFSLSVGGLGSGTAKASGLLSTAIVGGAVVSYAMGALKDHFDWRVAFLVPVICYLYIVFYGMSGYKSKETAKATGTIL